MTTPTMTIVLGLAMLALLTGCPAQRSAEEPREPEPRRRAAPMHFTGTLRGDVMAIGGETTGWVLEGQREGRGIEVDVSRVQADAQRLEGSLVTVSGAIVEREYVERGTLPVLVAERIVPAEQ